MHASRGRAVALLALSIAIVAGVTHVRSTAGSGVDFFQYWVVAEASREGVERLYEPETRASMAQRAAAEARRSLAPRQTRAANFRADGIEIFSTPFLYSAFRMFSGDAYEDDYRSYQLFSLLVGVSGMLLLAYALGFGAVESGLLLALLLGFEPYLSEVEVANVNRLQLFALAGFLALRTPGDRARTVAAGFVLGLLVALKPNAGPAVALLFATRLFDRDLACLGRELLGAGAALVLALGVSWLAMGGLGPWLAWPGAVAELFSTFDTVPVERGNFSVVQLLREGAGVDLASALPPLLGLTVAGLLAFGRRRVAPSPLDARLRDGLALGLGCAVMLAASRLAWIHYFLMCVLLFIAVMGAGRSGASTLRGLLGCLGLLLVSVLPARVAGVSTPAAAGWSVAGGNLLLLATGVWAFLDLRGRAESPDETA